MRVALPGYLDALIEGAGAVLGMVGEGILGLSESVFGAGLLAVAVPAGTALMVALAALYGLMRGGGGLFATAVIFLVAAGLALAVLLVAKRRGSG
ncbi:hypothetical protein [Acuticoccus mangrovi]|uniref:Uncharacterized protein n=1 Tax=Acuticoccus mangrovi TaxID=2796142 RepID=A0A934IMJ3_9HYPH|nr:hypothetical protein [Acuticoccus mangrovi]MBJ3775176.1 hypothetical protein [Acuticoccus mangrovi]